MKYVVVRPAGDLAKVFIIPDGVDVTLPFESWALRDGQQILFATTKMHKVLQSHHFSGSYESGALYAYTYEELCAIMRAHLGPSDEERYGAGLREQSNQTSIKDIPLWHVSGWTRIAYILWKGFELTVKVSIKILTTIIFLVILPFIIKWFNGFRK